MKKPLVILTRPLPNDWLTLLDDKVNLVIGDATIGINSKNVEMALQDAAGVICLLSDKLDESVLAKAPQLRVVSIMAAGYDNVDVAACTARKIPVGNTPGIMTNATADIAMGLLLSITRKIEKASADARNGLWQTWSPTGWLGSELDGKTIGILGMGKIGKAVAKRASAFGMKVIYYSRSTVVDGDYYRSANLEDLLGNSDVVSLHCPLNNETNSLINAHSLKLMKRSAILINTSRGKVVDQEALVEALKKGTIAGAALDVTDPEPLSASHPLFQLENCLILPHIGSATVETRKKMAEMACINLLAGLAGQKMPNVVDGSVYD